MTLVKAKIRFGHAPDARDAFKFYAIARNKVDTKGLVVSYVIEEGQALNERALRGELEVTVLSTHAFFRSAHRYMLLRSGSAVGEGTGPLIVSKTLHYPKELKGKRVAVPGKWSTSYLLLQMYDESIQPVFCPSRESLAVLERGEADAAVLTSETQMVSGMGAFKRVIDLGEWFYEYTKLPLPLAVSAVRSNLEPDLMRKIERIFRESALYALKHREEALDYAMKYAYDAPRDVIEGFVDRYVNDYTVDMGKKAKDALLFLQNLAKQNGFIEKQHPIKFIPS